MPVKNGNFLLDWDILLYKVLKDPFISYTEIMGGPRTVT